MKKERYAMPIEVMANPPQHDFAPAWLNFPSEQKPFKSHHYEHHHRYERSPRSDDRYESQGLSNRERHYSSESHLAHAGHPPLPPSHHAGYGYRGRDDKRHYPPQGYTRHHSLDDDRYHHNFYQSGDAIYPPGTLWRPRDGIYQHPNSRFGNGTYHNSGTNYHGNRGGGRQRYNSGSRNGYHEHGLADNQEDSIDGEWKDVSEASNNNNNSVDTEEKFEQDFPSLLGGDGRDSGGVKEAQNNKPAGVWDKPPNAKMHNLGGRRLQLIQKPPRNESTDSSCTSIAIGDTNPKLNPHAGIVNQAIKTATSNTASNSIYKSLVPSKGHSKSVPRKPPVKELNTKPTVVSVSQIKPAPPITSTIPSTTPPPPPQSFMKEVPQRPASTPPIEILNPRLVTAQTKKLDKSDFLKELRKGGGSQKDDSNKDDSVCSSDDDGGGGMNEEENGNPDNENKVKENKANRVERFSNRENISRSTDTLDVNHLENVTITPSPGSSPIKTELSSSLEAERRLLREMGWQEDIDEKPLTEDELREFQAITAKLDTKPGKLRNGFNHNLITKWSPVHNINKIHFNESESECSSDSSDDDETGP
ncbi:vasculin-like [Glandiceps talaboti]